MNLPSKYFKKSVLALSVTTAIALSSSVSAQDRIDFNSDVVNAAEYGNLEKLEGLIYMGADVNEVGDFDTTALIRATYQGSKEIAEFLLTNGANPNAVDMGGASALHIAAREGYADIAKMLVKAGADVDLEDDEGNTPLMRASAEGNERLAKLLVMAGAEVNKTNDSGESAIVYAAETNNEMVVAQLVENGATKNIIDEDGYSVDEIASRKGSEILVAKLDKADSNHIELFVTKSAPKVDSKKVLYRLEEENKIDFAGATTLGPSYSNEPRKDWLNGLKEVFDAAGAFELAAVKNYEAGTTYVLLDLGSFKDKEFANRRLKQLKEKHSAAFAELGLTIVEKGSGDNKTYNVSAGILNDKEEALKICKGLVADGINCRPVESALITAEQFGQFSVPLAQDDLTDKLADKVEVAEEVEEAKKEESAAQKSIFDLFSKSKAPEAKAPESPKTTLTKKLDNSVTKAPAERVVTKDLKAPEIKTPEPVKVTEVKKMEAPKLPEVKIPEVKKVVEVKAEEKKPIEVEVAEIKVPEVKKVEAPKLPELKKAEAPKVPVAAIKKVEPKKASELKKIEEVAEEPEDNLLDIAGMSKEKTPEVKVKVPAPAPEIKKVEAPKVPVAAIKKVEPKKAPESVKIAEAKEEKKNIVVADIKPIKKAKYTAEEIKPKAEPVKVAAKEEVQEDEISAILRDIFSEDTASTPPKDEPIKVTRKETPKTNAVKSLPKLTENSEASEKPTVKVVVADSKPKSQESDLGGVLGSMSKKKDIRAIPSKASSEKFKVSTPIKVTEQPKTIISKKPSVVKTTGVYNGLNSGFDVVGSKWVRISYFQSPGVANGYWNTVRKSHPNLPQNLRMRVVRAINSGNSYQAAQIGPFLNDADALNFCDTHAPKGTRCQIHQNVRDNYAPIVAQKAPKFNGYRGRHSNRRSTYGY